MSAEKVFVLCIVGTTNLKMGRAMDNDSIAKARSGLITIAARLIRGDGKPSPFYEDHKWAKTTPKTAISYAVQHFNQVRETDKRLAMAIKEIADSLTNDSKFQERK